MNVINRELLNVRSEEVSVMMSVLNDLAYTI